MKLIEVIEIHHNGAYKRRTVKKESMQQKGVETEILKNKIYTVSFINNNEVLSL